MLGRRQERRPNCGRRTFTSKSGPEVRLTSIREGVVLRLALDSGGHGVDLQCGRGDGVASVIFVLLADVVAELVFTCVWSGHCAVVRAEMGVWDLDVEL